MNRISVLLLLTTLASAAGAQQTPPKAPFEGIEKCIKTGDATALSAYFSNTVTCDLLGETALYSKAQATMVLKDFFDKHPPQLFSFNYYNDKQPVKYAIGALQTKDGGKWRVTVVTKEENKAVKIQQLTIENNQ
jgi:hypothetical protein